MVPREEPKVVAFTSSRRKEIVTFSTRFSAKLVCIAFGSVSIACYLLKTITTILYLLK